MVLLNLRNLLKEHRDLVQPLLAGSLGIAGIELGPLPIFPGHRLLKVVRRAADAAQPLIHQFAVDSFILCHPLKELGHFSITLLPGLVGKKEILIAGHRLPAEGIPQVLLGTRPFYIHIDSP